MAQCTICQRIVMRKATSIAEAHTCLALQTSSVTNVGMMGHAVRLPTLLQILVSLRYIRRTAKTLFISSSEEADEKLTDITALPDELLVLICNELESEDLAPFARSWNRIGGEHGVVSKFNVIRNRELLCFCLKKSFDEAQLGIGVGVTFRGRLGTFESEFDLLSLQAFEAFQIRRWCRIFLSKHGCLSQSPDVITKASEIWSKRSS